jgi:hypothetical protein
VCVCETIGAPSKLSVMRKAAALARMLATLDLYEGERRKSRDGSGTGHGRFAQAELLKLQKSGHFPDEPVRMNRRMKVSQIRYGTSSQEYQA